MTWLAANWLALLSASGGFVLIGAGIRWVWRWGRRQLAQRRLRRAEREHAAELERVEGMTPEERMHYEWSRGNPDWPNWKRLN